MENLLKIRLRAKSHGLGVDREYTIGMGKDLFQQWYVTISFGRFDMLGTDRTTRFTIQGEALRVIHQKLKQRLSSSNRKGCSYQIVSFDGSDDILSLVNKTIIERFSKFEDK